jgi:hypothetical protein
LFRHKAKQDIILHVRGGDLCIMPGSECTHGQAPTNPLHPVNRVQVLDLYNTVWAAHAGGGVPSGRQLQVHQHPGECRVHLPTPRRQEQRRAELYDWRREVDRWGPVSDHWDRGHRFILASRDDFAQTPPQAWRGPHNEPAQAWPPHKWPNRRKCCQFAGAAQSPALVS